MKTLTVFTPTYNRKHTLPRTYESLCRQTCKDFDWLVIDDGSSDGTKEWIMQLGQLCKQREPYRFDWMGRIEEGADDDNHFIIEASNVLIEYVYKPNGGLYTGYNVAYQTIQTELCVCIDSDDFMPDDAVEKILSLWREKGGVAYCGLVGLDFNVVNKEPIGGYFPANISEIYYHLFALKKMHFGDTKQVMRTELMKKVCPQIGFEGEKNFNPIYMLSQVLDKYPILVLNENLCWVEYQIGADSMSQGIFRQYVNSPRSFAKMRKMEMIRVHNTTIGRLRSAIHYVSSCIIAKDSTWYTHTTNKVITILAAPFGLLLYCYIILKTRK